MGERKIILVLITWLQTHGNKPKFGKQLEGTKKSKKERGNERVAWRSQGSLSRISIWMKANISALIFGFLLDLTRTLKRIQSQLTGPIWILV